MYCMINPFFYYEIIVNYMDRICFLIFKLVYKLLDLSIQKVMCSGCCFYSLAILNTAVINIWEQAICMNVFSFFWVHI